MFTPEQMKAYRAKLKAQAALRAFDLTQPLRVQEFSYNDEKPVIAPLSDKERKRLSRERKKAVVAELPDFLKLLKPVPEVKPLPVEAANDTPVFDEVICDWLTISHPLREYYPPVNDGQILKINADGTNEWTTECWVKIKCESSDTSLRIKCDGYKIMMTGNFGRFGQTDNLMGYTVAQCVEKAREVLREWFPARAIKHINPTTGAIEIRRFPALDLSHFFGGDVELVNRDTGVIELMGTRITRCDLAGNFFTDNYAALTAMLLTRKVKKLIASDGKYGATWGYDAKRQNWLRLKVYDKDAELAGRRTPATGATTARLEIQLGSENLKRRGLNILNGWKVREMENVIYAEFSKQVFGEQATVNNWSDMPKWLRTYAVEWREGSPIRNQCNSDATYYRVMKQLREHGLDCSKPCNVMTLVQRIEVVKVQPLPSRRVA
jgi:hypothetical protein